MASVYSANPIQVGSFGWQFGEMIQIPVDLSNMFEKYFGTLLDNTDSCGFLYDGLPVPAGSEAPYNLQCNQDQAFSCYTSAADAELQITCVFM